MKALSSDDKVTPEGGPIPPSTGLVPDAFPEVQPPVQAGNSPIGVSTKYAQSATVPEAVPAVLFKAPRQYKNPNVHWYALRAAYGQAAKANDYLVSQGVTTYYPTIKAFEMVNGKRRKVTKSYLLNILFAYGNEEYLRKFVYDNINLPYLRFYYRRETVGREVIKTPLIVPDIQLENLRKVCADLSGDLVIVPKGEHKFDKGTTVRITGGTFKGVIGKVARYCGQQRVAIVVDGLLTIATTFVPNAYLEKIE